MSVTPSRNAELENIRILNQFRLGVQVRAGAQVLLEESPPLQFIDAGAAINVDLPAEAVSKGLLFFIVNQGAATEIITVRDDAAATIATVDTNESCLVVCDGVAWRSLVGGIT